MKAIITITIPFTVPDALPIELQELLAYNIDRMCGEINTEWISSNFPREMQSEIRPGDVSVDVEEDQEIL